MNRLIKGEKGQALLTTLLLLLIGSLVLTPTLNFMGTGVKTGRVYEQKVDEIYAADAGVEDAMWQIRNDRIGDLLGGGYDEYDYSSTYPYPYNLLENGKNVTVTMQNVWIPKDISVPSPSVARQIIEDEKLIIVGYPGSSPSTYVIKIVYNWDTTVHRDELRVKTIGLWLSPGFEYDGGCDLEGRPWYSAPVVSLYKGGTAVVWTFASQPRLRQDFLPNTDTSNPLVRTFTFKYTGLEGQLPELVSSWVDTTGVSGINYSWDDSIRLYKIVSQAGGVHVEAYGAKTKFRKLKSTISSDYTVAGDTLEVTTGSTQEDRRYRNRLLAESSSTVLRIALEEVIEEGSAPPGYIPEEAIIDNVYLYWSGWIDPNYWYKSDNNYYWAQIPDLRYSQRTKQQLITNSKVGQVKFAVGGSAQTIAANVSDIQIVNTSDSGSSDSWAYSCFKDVTDLVVSGNVTVQEYIEEAMKSAGSGTATFTLGHASEVRDVHRPESSPAGAYANYYFDLYATGTKTGYPLATPAHKKPNESWQSRYQWSYAGWSLIIFYRSPGLTQRQLYLFDGFRYRSYLGGGDDPEFTISGFLAPPVISEQDKSHLTYFIGEGDSHYSQDSILVNGMYLSDAHNPEDNAFNSYSNALPAPSTDGEDVDTFELPINCILPYDSSAEVTLLTEEEIYTLVYLVLSFRSELTTGGIITNYRFT